MENTVLQSLTIGKTYVIHVMPGWIVSGTLDSILANRTAAKFKDVIFVESCVNGFDTIGAVSTAKDTQELKDRLNTYYPWTNGLILPHHSIGLVVECLTSMAGLPGDSKGKRRGM
jgi:hypothetical protein